MPVEDRSRLTSPFGWQEWRGYTHTGHDFGGITPGKSSPVYAAADGVVDLAGGSIPLRTGPQIKINHPDGSASTYGHTRYMKVRRGQTVRRGDRIADTWHTGLAASAGIHLHFEHWTDADDHTTRHDPTKWLVANGWVIRDGRLYDEQPVTLTPAATPRKEWSDMATEAEIRAVIREEIRNLPADVWAHLITTPEGKEAYASTLLSYGRRDAGNAAAQSRVSARVVEELAARSGMDRTEVAQIIRDAIAESVRVEGTLTVASKEN